VVAAAIELVLGMEVTDEIGLTGAYEFHLEYSRDPVDSDSALDLKSALEKQLGLKLEKDGKHEVLVIDECDRKLAEN